MHRGNERRIQHDVKTGKGKKSNDEKYRAVNRIAMQNHHQRRHNGNAGKNEKQDFLQIRPHLKRALPEAGVRPPADFKN
jgi:hypothetical protein